MNGKITLRIIRNTLGISRKVVQGYEKHGLIRPCGKDGYGHLVYNEETMERIIRIRFYQKLGFALKEIQKLIDMNDINIKKTFMKKEKEINKEIELLKTKTDLIQSLISSDCLPETEYMLKIAKNK